MNEYLEHIINGFTVLHVIKAILEMARYDGLMCGLIALMYIRLHCKSYSYAASTATQFI